MNLYLFFYLIILFRTFEIHGVDEIDELIKNEIQPSNVGPSSAAANITHAKPSRPGKGKVKISKFSASEDDE